MASLMLMALSISAASALEFKPFDQASFERAQIAGHPVLVEVHSTTSEPSIEQLKVLKAFADKGRFSEVTVYAIDIDNDPQNARLFGIGSDSTLVAFNGQKEIVRVVGDASEETIEILLRSTME